MKKIIKFIILIIAILLFLISLFLDRYVFNNLFLIKNLVFDIIFNWFTFLNVFVILILITTLFLFEERKREWIFPLWIAFIFASIISLILKSLITRTRPSAEIIYPLFSMLNNSFPSMHAMVSFAALPILNKEFPKLKWFWIIFAVLVAFSRIYLEFHFLSDVVFGALFGYFIGIFIIYIEEKYKPFRFLK